MKKYYVTTPIYYINDRPHIGHAYATIAADVLARYHEFRFGEEVFFATGLDENSQKTVDAAAKQGKSIEAYTDEMAGIWKDTWRDLSISNSDFIRTTEDRHKRTVYDLWQRIVENGNADIAKGIYEGLYCKGHEAFLKESELVDGLCPDHNISPERVEEENYFFNLSHYQSRLLDYYKEHPDFVIPAHRFEEVKRLVEGGLEDISISRKGRVWGIPVPRDKDHVIYVWAEALMNYVSVRGVAAWQAHPADMHIVGKDILRFHAVIWPALLMAANLPLPRQVAAHGFFTIDGIKISKSLGNAIEPLRLARMYSVDALRYFLLREIPFGGDGDFTEEKLKDRYRGDLVHGIGNFVSRVFTLAETHGAFPQSTDTPVLQEKRKEAREKVDVAMKEARFHEALSAIWDLIREGDVFINQEKPWQTKDVNVIRDLVLVVEEVATLVYPFMPETAIKIKACISHEGDVMAVKKGPILFPQIIEPKGV